VFINTWSTFFLSVLMYMTLAVAAALGIPSAVERANLTAMLRSAYVRMRFSFQGDQ